MFFDGFTVAGALVAARGGDVAACGLAGAEFQPEGHAFEFPFVEFFAGGVAVAEVGVDAEGGVVSECGGDCGDLVVQGFFLGVGGFGGDADGDDNDLALGDAGGDDEAFVVGVGHDHDADGAGGEAPGILEDVEFGGGAGFGGGGFDLDAEHFAEVLAEVVGRAALDAAACGGDVAFDGGGVVGAGEFLFFGLVPADDGDGKEVFVDGGVEFEDLADFLGGGFFGQVGRVAFLPVEFTGAEKGLWVFELPSDDGVPLV